MNQYFKKKVLFYLALLIVSPILSKFFVLQVIDYSKYKHLAGKNSIRSIEIKAPRGIIYDRNNIPMVDNVATYNLEIIPIDIIDRFTRKINEKFNFKLLESELGITQTRIETLVYNNYKGLSKFKPVTIKKFIDFEKKIIIKEHILDFPGLVFSEIPSREYVSKINLSHALGYLKLIDREKQNQLNHQDSLFNYSIGDVYGYSGIEKTYEHMLRGRNGIEFRLVDNRGVDHGIFNQKDGLEVISGPRLITTIDINIQSIAESLLQGKAGSIICMNPDNGEILAIASSPDYDLRPFKGPISQEQWKEWNSNEKAPLINRVISGEYPPGSVFKLVTAALLIEEGMEQTIYDCDGQYQLGSTGYQKKCWNPLGHGEINLKDAIRFSCNVYFYKAVENISFEKLSLIAQNFNYGEVVGIDLPSEKNGLIPDRKYMKKKYEFVDENGVFQKYWATGGTKANMGIGQGEVLTTPVQVVNMINIIANKGYYLSPHLSIKNKPPKKFLNLKSSTFHFLEDAMWKVVNSNGGTGKNAWIKNATIRGKTGTAQNPHGDDHSWFAGYITTNQSNKMSIVVMIENGGRGSGVSSEIARKIFTEFNLNN